MMKSIYDILVLLYKDPVLKWLLGETLSLLIFRLFWWYPFYETWPQVLLSLGLRKRFSLHWWKAQGEMTVQGVDSIAEEGRESQDRTLMSLWCPKKGGRMKTKWWLERRPSQQLLCIQHLECARPCREVGWKLWNPHSPAGYPGKSSPNTLLSSLMP